MKLRILPCVLVTLAMPGSIRSEGTTQPEPPTLKKLMEIMEASSKRDEGQIPPETTKQISDRTDAPSTEGLLSVLDAAQQKTDGKPPLQNIPDTAPLRAGRRTIPVAGIREGVDRGSRESGEDLPPPALVIDGSLDDPLWEQASTSSGFWCSLENRPPSDPTGVWVARDDDYLYFGFRMYDSRPELIQSTKTVRDTGLGYDDSITVQLDSYFNRRDISEFSLNPLGTQNDDFAGGRSRKIEWKGDWLGAAARDETGWSAEFAIPFSILNYNPSDTVFGINFKRYQSRTKEYSYWSDITPQALNEEMGQLSGLELPSAKSRSDWTFMPFILAGKDIPDKEGDIQDTLVTGGIDIRYEPRPDLTGMISLNPDFSQVEQDVTDISFSYTEKELDDNRPFFSEGSRYFAEEDDGNEYFYSNRAADFDYGAKSFGRFGRTKFGILGTSAPDNRYDFSGRGLYEIDDTHSAVAAGTATKQEAFDNVLGVVQIKGRQENGFKYALDAAATDTRTDDPSDPVADQGSHLMGELGWKWDYWYVKSEADQYDVAYYPALALLDEDLPGTRSGSAAAGYYQEQAGHLWRVADGYAGYRYRETLDGDLQSRKWYAGGRVEFENQIRTSGYAEQGPYRPADDIRGEFKDYTNDDRYYSLALDVNTRSSLFSAGTQYDWGNLGGGDYQNGSVYGWLRPISQIYLKGSYEITDYFGISEQAVFNASWDITPENSVGARYIYYESAGGRTDEYIRLTYGRKARRGLDVFVVYDKDPYRAEQYSLKLVYSF